MGICDICLSDFKVLVNIQIFLKESFWYQVQKMFYYIFGQAKSEILRNFGSFSPKCLPESLLSPFVLNSLLERFSGDSLMDKRSV